MCRGQAVHCRLPRPGYAVTPSDEPICTRVSDPFLSFASTEKRFISNGLTVTLNDGTVLPEVHIDYPVGHKRRREEGTPLLEAKFERHVKPHFDGAHVEKILKLVADQKSLEQMPVKDFTDLFVTKA